MAVLVLGLPAHGQSVLDDILAQVDACDVLAAHPDDPLRVAPGVPDGEMVPRLAVEACEEILPRSTDKARHAFQLGRAKLELDQREEAIELFWQAAEAGSSLAMILLGDAEQFGWLGEGDPAKALAHYREARDRGLLIADIAIAQVTFDPGIFSVGAMLQVLAERDIPTAVDFARTDLAPAYLYAFAAELADRCGTFLAPESVPALQDYRFPEGWSAASEEADVAFGRQDVYATYDVEILVDRHGCEGSVVESIADSYNALMAELAKRK